MDTPEQVRPELQAILWDAVGRIASSETPEAAVALADLKGVLNVGPDDDRSDWERVHGPLEVDVHALNENGLRPIDLIAGGRDSEAACYATLFLAQAGSSLDEQPSPAEPSPIHAAAYHGNWQILNTLIDLGADPHQKINAMRCNLMGSTAIHAVATGFRAAREEDFGQCFASLLEAGVDINARDRRRQSPIDIAMKSAANTGSKSLVDAMLNYGVDVASGASNSNSASAMAMAITRRTGNAELIAQMSKAAMANVANMARSQRALQAVAEHDERSSAPQP